MTNIEELLKLPRRTIVEFTCKNCNKVIKKTVGALRKNPITLCKACLMKEKYGSASNFATEKGARTKRETLMEKYGTTNLFEIGREAREKTNIQKYGQKHAVACDSVKLKIKKTNNEKYGGDSPFSSDIVRKKAEESMLDKYGVKNAAENPILREKMNETCTKRYGGNSPANSKAVVEKQLSTCIARYNRPCNIDLEKAKKTNIAKYGVENATQSLEVQEKIKKTVLERYGSEYYFSSEDYQKKAHKKYRFRDMTFDSAWEIAFYVWCEETGKKIQRNYQPGILSSGKRIFVDFIVDGQLVEVKGDHLKNMPDWEEKCRYYVENSVKVYFYNDMKPILKYIYAKHGRNYLRQFRKKTADDFRRRAINISSLDEAKKHSKKNVKFHYECKSCGDDVFTSWYELNKFNDFLCKRCRKKAKQLIKDGETRVENVASIVGASDDVQRLLVGPSGSKHRALKKGEEIV